MYLLNIKHYGKLKLFLACLFFLFICAIVPREQLPNLPIHEKVQHVLAFAFLTLIISFKRKWAFTMLCVALLLLGGVMELVQPLLNRSAEWGDMVANTIGVLIIYIPAFLLKCLFERPPRWQP